MIVAAEEPLDEVLGGVDVFSVLEHGHTLGDPGHPVRGVNDGQVVLLGGLLDAGVDVGDADSELTGRDLVLRVGSALAVVGNVVVQGLEVVPALIALGLQQRVDHGVVGAGNGRVGHDDLALILAVSQVIPALGSGQTQLLHERVVEQEADNGDALGIPVTLGILVLVAELGGRVKGDGLKQAVVLGTHERVDAAAEPQVSGRGAALGAELGEHLAGGHGQAFDLHAGVGGERVEQGTVDVAGGDALHRAGELGSGVLRLVGRLRVVSLRAAGDQREHHHDAKQQRKQLFHN